MLQGYPLFKMVVTVAEALREQMVFTLWAIVSIRRSLKGDSIDLRCPTDLSDDLRYIHLK